MAAITICSDFGTHKNKISLFPLFSPLFAMKWWDPMSWSFLECWALSHFFHSPLLPSSRGSSGGSDQNLSQEKEMQKAKTVVWGGLTNS